MNTTAPVSLLTLGNPCSNTNPLKKLKVGDYIQLHIRYGVIGRPFYAKDGDYYRQVSYKRVVKINEKSFCVANDIETNPKKKNINMTYSCGWANHDFGLCSSGKYVKAEDYDVVKDFNDKNKVEYFDL